MLDEWMEHEFTTEGEPTADGRRLLSWATLWIQLFGGACTCSLPSTCPCPQGFSPKSIVGGLGRRLMWVVLELSPHGLRASSPDSNLVVSTGGLVSLLTTIYLAVCRVTCELWNAWGIQMYQGCRICSAQACKQCGSTCKGCEISW